MKPIITVKNVTMKFNLMEEKIDTFKEFIMKLIQGKLFYNEFISLKNINFSINQGDILGIIGFNGAGKSTILKILSGILKPSQGKVEVNGKVAPLIEVGAGFDPDLTARENIFLNGAILGYDRNFLKQHFDEIIDFAELRQFIDVPLKNFSSGMYARLGFSIATIVHPDILIVDEVLSVGDINFQKKCEERIQKMISSGTTIIIVSHDIEMIERLCNKVLWLDKGIVKDFGNTVKICDLRPKPMVEIGGMPILWHIMKTYAHYGFNDFIICAGYKQHIIKEYFAEYYLHMSDVTFDFEHENKTIIHNHFAEPWKVTIVDTGLHTLTGGRVKRIQKYIGDEDFMLTYGDAVSDVNIVELLKFHKNSGKQATLTAVQPGGRFGTLDIDASSTIQKFAEKTKESGGWINAGFMVLSPKVFDLIEGDDTILERYPLETLSAEGELAAYKHNGFWQCMDTLKEKNMLEDMWASGNAPWKVWDK